MMKPVLTLAVMGLLCGMGIFRAAPALAQDEQEQSRPPEQEEEPEPAQPAQDEQVDPVLEQQRRQQNACIMSGTCTCLYGVCTDTATGARFPAPKEAAFVGEWYAAIAKSATNAAWGASWHAASQAEANQVALANCNQNSSVKDCKVVIGDVNNCLSLAESPNGAWGSGKSAMNRPDAIRVATQYCKQYGGTNCTAKVSVCGRQPVDSKPCFTVGPGIDISHWSPAALASLTPAEREAFQHPAKHTNGACQ